MLCVYSGVAASWTKSVTLPLCASCNLTFFALVAWTAPSVFSYVHSGRWETRQVHDQIPEGRDPLFCLWVRRGTVQTLNQRAHAILLFRMLPCACGGLMKCERALGTCDMYCYDTPSTNMGPWLLTSLKLRGFWSRKVKSNQVRFIYKALLKKSAL